MTYVNGVNTNFNNQYQAYLSQPMNVDQLGGQNSDPISFQAEQQKADENRVDNVKDGKDDGKIGFWRATGHLLKGVGKFFLSGFTDENGNFSLGRTLLTAGMIALCAVTWGTAIPAALAIFGAASGAKGMASSIYNICTAETDAEDEAAWESLGSSTTQVAVSTAALCKMTGNSMNINGIKNAYKDAGTQVLDAGKGYFNGAKSAVGDATGFKGKFGALREYNAQQYGNLKTTMGKNYAAMKEALPTKAEPKALAANNPQTKALTIYDEANADAPAAGIFKSLWNKTKNGFSEVKTGTKAISKFTWENRPEGTMLMAASNAGRAEQSSAEAKMMSMLSPEEKRYVASLPKEQREQMVKQFERYAA